MAARSNRGEVGVTIDGADYVLRFGLDELEQLEQEWGLEGAEAVVEHAQKKAAHLVKFAQVLLSRHHPNLKKEEVVDLFNHLAPEPVLAEVLPDDPGFGLLFRALIDAYVLAQRRLSRFVPKEKAPESAEGKAPAAS